LGLRKDIWRPAIVDAPIGEILRRGSIEGLPVHWLPPMGSFRFLADPFGLWRDGVLHVFVETYDYRVRIGTIELLRYTPAFDLIDRRIVLAEPWHLSYPYVFEADGETWMLPEAHRSGALTLYLAVEFPHRWQAAACIPLDTIAVDATPLFHNGLWWLFYAGSGSESEKMGALHIAYAERLAGPWHVHPGNPLRVDTSSSRPGGTPSIVDGRVVLPVQDCSHTYGGAIRPLTFDRLTPDSLTMTAGDALTPPAGFAPYIEGLHTLAAAGDVTLIDVKRTILSLHGLAIEALRELRKRRKR
jgi:hypothetical protein